MSFPFTFATFPPGNFPAADWDSNWNAVGLATNIVCTVGGTANAITLTTASNAPVASGFAIQQGMVFWFVAASTNTGGATIAINGGGALAVYNTDAVASSGGEFFAGALYGVYYDSGLPGLRIVSNTSHFAGGQWTFTYQNDPKQTLSWSNTGANTLSMNGIGNSKTTSFHLNPGSGTPPASGTIVEYTLEITGSQQFISSGGTGYERWSFSAIGPGINGQVGLIGEHGGVGFSGGDFVIQDAFENPGGVFTVSSFMTLATTSGGTDHNLGAVLFGDSADFSSINKISLVKSSIGAAGHRDSNKILWEGKSNSGTDVAVWWNNYVNVTTSGGTSQLVWQNTTSSGGAFANRATLSDAGVFNAPGGLNVGTFNNNRIQLSVAAINFNSANTDTNFAITLPVGYSNYRIPLMFISNASQDLSTSTFGVFTLTGGGGGGGVTLVTSGTANTITTGNNAANNNMLQINNFLNTTTQSYAFPNIYFRVITPQGAAATATVTMVIEPVS